MTANDRKRTKPMACRGSHPLDQGFEIISSDRDRSHSTAALVNGSAINPGSAILSVGTHTVTALSTPDDSASSSSTGSLAGGQTVRTAVDKWCRSVR
jgi:hypothetical protein